MNDIFEMKKLQDGCPVMVAKIPEQILAEIDLWVEESRGFKDHPLATLKAHENVGYKALDGRAHNSYQCSISPHLIEQSFWLAWVLRLTQKYWGMGKNNRNFKLFSSQKKCKVLGTKNTYSKSQRRTSCSICIW